MSQPYYVYAPPYTATSAGSRALYELAHLLNGRGQRAFMIPSPYLPDQYQVGGGMAAPLLTRREAERHQAEGDRPIVVYSETVDGDPLKASAIVRYVMNTPGLLGGPSAFAAREFVYGFSRRLADDLGVPDRALFIPVVDPEGFQPGSGERHGIYVYAAKYRAVHDGRLFGMPDGAIELTRDLTHSPDPDALREILKRAERLYLFENSAIAIEAVLCGCPVVMMPNPYLRYSIGEWDHGHAGIAWGAGEIAQAEATVGAARAGYEAAIARLPGDLDRFIYATQGFRSTIEGFGVSLATLRPPAYEELAADAASRLLRERGLWAVARKGVSILADRGPLTSLRIAAAFLSGLIGHPGR